MARMQSNRHGEPVRRPVNRFTAEHFAASAAAGERTVSDFPDKHAYQDWFVSTITSGAETLLAPGDPGRATRWKAVRRQHDQIEQARTRQAAQRATDESEPAQPAQQPHRTAIQRERYVRDKREEREAQRATGLNLQGRQELFRVTQQRLQMRYFLDQARCTERVVDVIMLSAEALGFFDKDMSLTEWVEFCSSQVDSYLIFTKRDSGVMPSYDDEEDVDQVLAADIARFGWSEDELLQRYDDNFNLNDNFNPEIAIGLAHAATNWLDTHGRPAEWYDEYPDNVLVSGRDVPECHYATGVDQEEQEGQEEQDQENEEAQVQLAQMEISQEEQEEQYEVQLQLAMEISSRVADEGVSRGAGTSRVLETAARQPERSGRVGKQVAMEV